MYTTNNEVTLMTSSKNYKKIINALKRKSSLKITNVIHRENSLIFHTPKTEEVLTSLVKMVKGSRDHIVKLTISRPSLEEVFIRAHKK